MIIGFGIDIVKIDRIKRALERFGLKFSKRLFSHNEIQQIPQHAVETFHAKRFAAKEAISKAIGCGIGRYLSFHDIEISKNQLGRPIVQISDKIVSSIRIIHGVSILKSNIAIHLSISDEIDYAIANAILEVV